MATSWPCGSERRRALIQEADPPVVNGIDYLLVADRTDGAPVTLRQRLLLVRCFSDLGVASISAANVTITGGDRIPTVAVRWALPLAGAGGAAPLLDTSLTPEDVAWLASTELGRGPASELARWFVVYTESTGDTSRYTLALRASATSSEPPASFDRVLSQVAFSFKVECPSPFDCAASTTETAPASTGPVIDYTARDFAAVRQALLDRLAVLQPAQARDNVAELRTVLVELFAHAADQLAYYQDAVGTEAWLGTARRRTSVRRHARLLGYAMHEGHNARAWVHLVAASGVERSGTLLPAGTRFSTRVPSTGPVVGAAGEAALRAWAPEIFESCTVLDRLSATLNGIRFHTWGELDGGLEAGATEAWLVDPGGLALRRGDVLLFEAVGGDAGADPTRRWVVRLTTVDAPVADALVGVDVVRVAWGRSDALPWPLVVCEAGDDRAVARGNLVLVDHGDTVADEPVTLLAFGRTGRRRARLQETELSFAAPLPVTTGVLAAAEGEVVAASAFGAGDPRRAVPQLTLSTNGELWTCARDLLQSSSDATAVCVEVESDAVAWLRFGDDVHGRAPAADASFRATYRVGNGTAGNVGAEAIAHVLSDAADSSVVTAVRNPIAAQGGVDPETIAEVKRFAPEAFRAQARAVTEDDWETLAMGVDGVSKAVATIRWTGSWHTVYLSVDREDGAEVDAAFRATLADALEPYRLTGYDLEILPPSPVPVSLALSICVSEQAWPEQVEAELLRVFGTGLLPDGSRAFFHPDNFSFGDPLFLSAIIARAMQVPGVRRVDSSTTNPAHHFERVGDTTGAALADGRITAGLTEIIRCDSDPDHPERGQVRFYTRRSA